MKQVKSFRLNRNTIKKLKALAVMWGTSEGEIVSLAIQKFYTKEIEMTESTNYNISEIADRLNCTQAQVALEYTGKSLDEIYADTQEMFPGEADNLAFAKNILKVVGYADIIIG